MQTDRQRSSLHASGRLSAHSQTIAPPQGLRSGRAELGLADKRDGAIVVPDTLSTAKPAPLVVALHGAGGIAAQMLDLLEAAARKRGIILLAPESRAATWDVIRGGYGPDVAFIDEALRQTFARHLIDPQRIAVAGFSDGASYALSLGLTNGELFGHVMAFSPGFMAPMDRIGMPRIFISHGVEDEVLPIGPCSRRLVPALQRSGYDVEYAEFPGGHIVPPAMVERAMDRFLG